MEDLYTKLTNVQPCALLTMYGLENILSYGHIQSIDISQSDDIIVPKLGSWAKEEGIAGLAPLDDS